MRTAAKRTSKAALVAEKDRAIVLAAREHFLQDGFAGTSMDAIANSAGVSVKTIYSHFANKDELFSKVMIATCSDNLLSSELLPDSELAERFAWYREATRRGLMEAGQEYLADGIVEAITAALSCIRSFFVIARSSAFTYKGRATDAREIGKDLGVAYLLEGSVQKAGNRLRIIVQLIETEAGAHVWSSRFDGAIDDFFDLQDRITEQVAGALQPSIRIAEIERSRRKRPQDLGSYDYTMRAMPHVWALEKDESSRALVLLEQALRIDPEYPLAIALAGWCHAQRAVYNWTDSIAESQAMAQTLAEQAAHLSGDDPLILTVLGAVHTFVRNHGTARVLLERALALDPNSAWTWSRLGWIDAYSDRPKEAIEKFERALRLSPIDPMNFNNFAGLGSAHELMEDYDKAAAFMRRALEERPNARWIYRSLAATLSGAGRTEEARQAFAEMLLSYPDITATKFRQAMVFSSAALDRMVENLRKLGLPD